MKIYSITTLIIAAVLLVGCASSQPKAQDSDTGRTCVRVRQINSYSALDDRHVYVNVTGKDDYMLTVDFGCPGLTFARGIAISEQSSQVCGDGSGLLTFNQPGAGARRCRIITIDKVENQTEAKALIASRTAE